MSVKLLTWSKLLLIKYGDQRYIPTSNASNTQIKYIYTYNTYIKYRDKISVINRQSQLTTFTSNQPTVGLYCEKSNSMYQAQFTRILSPRDTKIL